MKIVAGLTAGITSAALVCSGCASVNTMRAASDSAGRTITFSAPYPMVFRAAATGLQNLGFQLDDYNQEGHYIYAKHGMSAWSWGEVAGLRFKEIGEATTSVQIIDQRVLVTNITAPEWTEQIRTQIFMELEQMKARAAAASQVAAPSDTIGQSSMGSGGTANQP